MAGGCAHARNENVASPPVYVAVDPTAAEKAKLSGPQRRIVQAALSHSSRKDEENLIFTVFKGILILYYGDPAHLNGIVSPGTGDCPSSMQIQCRGCCGQVQMRVYFSA